MMQSFADKPDSADYQAVVESAREVSAESVLPLRLAAGGGGFAAIISRR